MSRNILEREATIGVSDKTQLENARKLRGICFIALKDEEYKEIIKDALRKFEIPEEPGMPC